MSEHFVSTSSGLEYKDIVAGTGKKAGAGSVVTVHYTGMFDSGEKFDSSYDRGEPLTFTIGNKEVIAGWEEGIKNMHVGGKRTLIIPPHLGYGDAGIGPIPGGATLYFDVELVDVK